MLLGPAVAAVQLVFVLLALIFDEWNHGFLVAYSAEGFLVGAAIVGQVHVVMSAVRTMRQEFGQGGPKLRPVVLALSLAGAAVLGLPNLMWGLLNLLGS